MDLRILLKVLVVTTFISTAVASWFLYPITEAGHVAAWVQAIGSIGAICAAIWISRQSQDRLLAFERGRDIDAATLKLEPIVGLIVALDVEIRDARKVADGKVCAVDYYAEDPARKFGLLLEELDRVIVGQLPTVQLVISLLDIRQEVRDFLPRLIEIQNNFNKNSNRPEVSSSSLDGHLTSLEKKTDLKIQCFKVALENTKVGKRAEMGAGHF